MKLSEIKTGEIFTIGETPSYPKLRIENGYVDMRDLIIKKCEDIPFDLRVMEQDEVALNFDISEDKVDKWIQDTEALI